MSMFELQEGEAVSIPLVRSIEIVNFDEDNIYEGSNDNVEESGTVIFHFSTSHRAKRHFSGPGALEAAWSMYRNFKRAAKIII